MDKLVEINENELPLTHSFSEGVYAREIFMPKGMVVIGHVHNTTHLNIVSTGRALVYMNDTVVEIVAPFTFESKKGTRKVLYILEDMFWSTIHITNSKDIDELENTLVDRKASDNLLVDVESIKTKLLKCKGE